MRIESSIGDTESVHSTADPSASSSDWTTLFEFGVFESWAASWLRIQVRWIGGVTRAAICRREGDEGPIEWIASLSPDDHPVLEPQIEATFAAGGDLAGALPESEDLFVVSHLLETSEQARIVVAVEVEGRSQKDLAEVLRQLQWGGRWIDSRLKTRSEPVRIGDHPGPEQAQPLLDLIASTLEARSFGEAAQALVAHLARLLACDRVSLGVEERGRIKLVALSHSAGFAREMNLVRAIEAAMEEARDQHATIVYGLRRDETPHVVREHAALAREHGAGTILTIPLERDGALSGALTFEHGEVDAFSGERIRILETVALAVAPILELRRRDDRPLVSKIVDSARIQLERLFGPDHLTRKLVLAGLVLISLFFFFAKGAFRIGAEGVLEGASRRVVIAPFDGYVAAAEHRAGDFVEAGEELARLDDRELELEHLKWKSRLIQLERQVDESRAAREYGRTSVLVAQVDEARAEIARLEERLARTRIMAPFDGLVVSGDLSQSLGAAVSRGDVLFEVAPLERYRVLLKVDEGEIADVAVGQKGMLLTAAMPGEPLAFEITKVTPIATAEEGRNFFRVEATLLDRFDWLRPGMEGVGKIDVDRRHLIWIWTRGFQNWFRLWIWSWWPSA